MYRFKFCKAFFPNFFSYFEKKETILVTVESACNFVESALSGKFRVFGMASYGFFPRFTLLCDMQL